MNSIYFFNSANFGFANIDFRKKNLFFVGDNGSGKTTAIRAIQFYFNSDVKSLGIDSSKKSFKDFYFQYQNSYIVYEFENYFVFMYKRRGDIKRIFSNQKFDYKKLIKDNIVIDLEDALRYVKSSDYKIVSTNEEFKRIIYGLDANYIDYKIATIRDYNTFINLYNKIFNVTKSVFDVDSIKRVIFTTLNNSEAGEIDYQKFLYDIKEYRRYFSFYHKFNSQKNNINLLKQKKDLLLENKEKLDLLKKQINYRSKLEEDLINNLINKLNKLDYQIQYIISLKSYANKKANQIEKCLEKEIRKIEFDIENISKLKNKFTIEKLNKAKKDIELIEKLENEKENLIVDIKRLESNLISQKELIEEEIRRLKLDLKRIDEEIEIEKLSIKRELNELKEEEFLKLEDLIKQKDLELYNKLLEIENNLEKELEKKEEILNEIEKIKSFYKEEKNNIIETFEKEKALIKNNISKLKFEIETITSEIYQLKLKKQKTENEYKELKSNIEKEYRKKIKTLQEKIEFFESILETKQGSFKEFLNKNVEDWEIYFYPLIDETILNIDINKLQPKIISDKIIGIEYNKNILKRIPTLKEAENNILSLTKEIQLLEKELKDKLYKLEEEFKQKIISIDAEKEFQEESITKIKKELEKLTDALKIIDNNLKNSLKSIEEKERYELKSYKIKQQTIEQLINSLQKQINSINKEKNSLKSYSKKEKKEIELKFKNLLNKKLKELEKIKIEKKDKINKKIKELQNSKSLNNKENDLYIKLEKINQELNILYKSKEFIKDYERVKDEINSLSTLKDSLIENKKRLEKFNIFILKLYKKYEEKIADLESEKKSIQNELEEYKHGLRELKKIKINTNEKIETNIKLIDLIKEYIDLESKFNKLIIDIKYLADKIRTSLIRFLIDGLEVDFNLELLDKLDKKEIEKIDELYLFANKKFDILNKTTLENIKNLIEGLLNKRIDIFEDSKNDFISQIERVNRNLSKVDFSVIKSIKIEIEDEKNSILSIFKNIKILIEKLSTLMEEGTLFFDLQESRKLLLKIESLLDEINSNLQNNSFSLIDVLDISLSFIENSKKVNNVKIIKEESSTGGSILLKVAIAVSLIELFLDKANLFFILDEVSVLSTKNQKLLKEFVNQKGLSVIYITPDLPLVDLENIDIYKFRSVNGEFEAIKLISSE